SKSSPEPVTPIQPAWPDSPDGNSIPTRCNNQTHKRLPLSLAQRRFVGPVVSTFPLQRSEDWRINFHRLVHGLHSLSERPFSEKILRLGSLPHRELTPAKNKVPHEWCERSESHHLQPFHSPAWPRIVSDRFYKIPRWPPHRLWVRSRSVSFPQATIESS